MVTSITSTTSMTVKNGHVLAILCLLSGIGFATVTFATRWGAGLNVDSLRYVDAARNLLQGQGISLTAEGGRVRPMTQFPPFYPVLLAASGLFGIDPRDGARWVATIFFAANIALVGLIAATGNRGSPPVGVLASVLMLLSPDMLRVHSMAWSEPPFIFFAILALALLASYLNGAAPVVLVAAAITAALAVMTRYVGVALIAGGVTSILVLGRRHFRQRLQDSLIFGAICCVPAVGWAIRNALLAHDLVNGTVAFHPIKMSHLEDAADAASAWVLPGAPLVLRTSAVILMLVSGMAFFVQHRNTIGLGRSDQTTRSLRCVLIVFAACYIATVIATISFLLADTPMDFRILSPVYVALLIVAIDVGARMVRSSTSWYLRAAAGTLLAAVLGAYLSAAPAFVWHAHDEGQGYASKSWQRSPIIQQIRALPEQTPIFSNRHDAIRLLTGRWATRTPWMLDPGTGRENPGWAEELAKLRHALRDRDGVLVYFKRTGVRGGYMMSEEQLKKHLPLRLMRRARDGVIYRWEDRRSESAH